VYAVSTTGVLVLRRISIDGTIRGCLGGNKIVYLPYDNLDVFVVADLSTNVTNELAHNVTGLIAAAVAVVRYESKNYLLVDYDVTHIFEVNDAGTSISVAFTVDEARGFFPYSTQLLLIYN